MDAPPVDRQVAFLLPGQGSQHRRMAAGLYGRYDAFTGAMDEVFELLGADGPAVREDWLSERPRVSIDHVTRSQILLFAVDYALATQLTSWGVRPAALLGHSVGEIAGAVLAGVFRLADGVALMWDRIGRLAAAPPGGLLAVAGTVEAVRGFCTDEVVVGAVNAPRQVILAGPAEPLAAVTAALRAADFTVYPVPASTAFHSPMLAEVASGAVPMIAQLPVRPPRVRLQSGYTTKPLTGEDVARPELWASHPVAPVLFWPAVDALLADGAYLLVETGPGQGLASVVRRHPQVLARRSQVLAALPARPAGDEADRESLERLAEQLLAAAGR
ncbi:MAG TPA: acyltransferase domain-containing protein [Micromonosporaceae bacterium]|nr:acyltransferase domain-containing protein [Micromonosporaceae bacterium]